MNAGLVWQGNQAYEKVCRRANGLHDRPVRMSVPFQLNIFKIQRLVTKSRGVPEHCIGDPRAAFEWITSQAAFIRKCPVRCDNGQIIVAQKRSYNPLILPCVVCDHDVTSLEACQCSRTKAVAVAIRPGSRQIGSIRVVFRFVRRSVNYDIRDRRVQQFVTKIFATFATTCHVGIVIVGFLIIVRRIAKVGR